MSEKTIYIAFDFSMNKPAMVAYHMGKLYFYLWPSKLSDAHAQKYHECNVNVFPRGLEPINTKKTDNTQLVLIHTIRSTDLANQIIADIDTLIEKTAGSIEEAELYICSEGLSYGSKGDASLNLATYKGVLLSKIYEHYGVALKRLYTYAAMTIKATAGCAGKKDKDIKMPMIDAFCRMAYETPFKQAVVNKELIAKTKYIDGVDDLVDAYWTLITMIKKEKMPFKI